MEENAKGRLADSLHVVEDSKRGLDYEVGTLLTPYGEIIQEYVGSAHWITVPEVDRPLFEGNVFTHNHPGGRNLTIEDINSFVNYKLYEARASTPQGTYFSLKESAGEINRSIGRVMREEKVDDIAEAVQVFLKRGLKQTGAARNSIIFDIMAEEVDNWLTENAGEFGYIYTKGMI